MSDALRITVTATGVRFDVRVQPRASRTKVVGLHAGPGGGAIKIALAAPPVDGAANDALLDFVADALGLPKRAVRLVHGETSRNKTLDADGVTADQVRALLA